MGAVLLFVELRLFPAESCGNTAWCNLLPCDTSIPKKITSSGSAGGRHLLLEGLGLCCEVGFIEAQFHCVLLIKIKDNVLY